MERTYYKTYEEMDAARAKLLKEKVQFQTYSDPVNQVYWIDSQERRQRELDRGAGMAVEAFNPMWLVIARQSRGMTQKELSSALSINQGWLSRIESGLRPISEDLLSQIAKVLGYPVAFFHQPEPPYLLGLLRCWQ